MDTQEAARLDLRQPDLWRVLTDSSLAGIGMGGEMVVEGWLVFELTGSTLAVGSLYLFHFLALGPVGLAAGTLSDRIDRRRLLRGIELALAVDFAVFALLVGAGAIALWHVYALSAVAGAAFAVYFPVRAAYAHDLVGGRRVVAGLGLVHVGSRLGELVGALAAGAVIERVGVAHACALLVAAHATAFFVLRGLRAPGVSHEHEGAGVADSLRDFGREIRANRSLRSLFLLTLAVEIFAFSYWTALPEISSRRLELGAQGLATLNAARAVGGLLMGLALAWSRDLRRGRTYLAVIAGFGAGLLWLAGADTLLACALAVLCLAALESAVDVLNQGMMQSCVPDRLRGRAMGAWALAIGISPLGHLQIGALATSLGLAAALGLHGGALLAVAALALLLLPDLRRL